MRIERIGLEYHRDAALGGRQMRHVGPADLHGPIRNGFQPGDHAQERGLAAAGRAKQRAERAVCDRKIEIADDFHGAETLADALQFNRCHFPFLGPTP
jgi:hypothetical protein